MGTNKTRLVWIDYSGSAPNNWQLLCEFDIYQEAVDYVETSLPQIASLGGSNMTVFLYSVDNTSYKYNISGSYVITKTEITYPNLLT